MGRPEGLPHYRIRNEVSMAYVDSYTVYIHMSKQTLPQHNSCRVFSPQRTCASTASHRRFKIFILFAPSLLSSLSCVLSLHCHARLSSYTSIHSWPSCRAFFWATCRAFSTTGECLCSTNSPTASSPTASYPSCTTSCCHRSARPSITCGPGTTSTSPSGACPARASASPRKENARLQGYLGYPKVPYPPRATQAQ